MSSQSGQRVSRRTVAKGAAWALPVVAFAEAAPAASASTVNQVCSVTVVGAGVKQTRGKNVTISFSVQNSGSVVENVSFASIVGPANVTWSGPTPSSWPAGPGQSSQDVQLSRGNNASGVATVTLQVCGHSVPVNVSIGN